MDTRTRQSITLTAPQIAYLRAEAERLDLTIADVVRRIIDEHRSQKPSPGENP